MNSNQTLNRFIQHHRDRLDAARGTAFQIRRELTTLFPLIDRVSRATCPRCLNACCIVTKVWFDFTDLLFFHLISVPLPPGPLAHRLEAPCQYLSPRGCRLSRLVRPWGCLKYTCPAQRRYLREPRPEDETGLDLALSRVKSLRHILEDQFQRAVRPPSSRTLSPPNRSLSRH